MLQYNDSKLRYRNQSGSLKPKWLPLSFLNNRSKLDLNRRKSGNCHSANLSDEPKSPSSSRWS